MFFVALYKSTSEFRCNNIKLNTYIDQKIVVCLVTFLKQRLCMLVKNVYMTYNSNEPKQDTPFDKLDSNE